MQLPSETPCRDRAGRGGDRRGGLGEHAGAAVQVALAQPVAHDRSQRQVEIFGDIAAARHIGASAAADARLFPATIHARGADDIVCCHTRTVGGRSGVEGLHSALERLETVDIAGDEFLVIELLVDYDLGNGAEQDRVLAGAALQVDVGLAGAVGHPRVDHDQLHPALLCVMQLFRRVHAETAIHRHHRIGADQHQPVPVSDARRSGEPRPDQGAGDALAGLVDGDTVIDRGRSDRFHQRQHEGMGVDIIIAEGADIGGDRIGAMFVDDPFEASGDIARRIAPVHRLLLALFHAGVTGQ